MRTILGTILAGMCSVAGAAELEVLPPQRLDTAGMELLELGNDYFWGVEFARSMEIDSQRVSVEERWLWAFDDGLATDGAHTYDTLHMVAAWQGLSAHPVIRLTGPIAAGDADRLEALIAEQGLSNCLSPGYCPFAPVLQLDSVGGSFSEALRLTEIIERENLITQVPANAQCLSACTLVFLAGFTRYEGYFFPRRFAHTSAEIGFHQPSFPIPPGTYDAAQVQQMASLLNEVVNRAAGFFAQAGVSLNLLGLMYETPPEDMQLLTPIWGATEGIFYYGQPEPVAPLAARREDVLAYCAEEFRAEHGGQSQSLIDTLQLDSTAFISFEPGSNFVCSGVLEGDTWRICRGRCEFGRLGQASFTPEMREHRHWRVIDSIMVGVDNTELGIAIKDFAHRGGLLTYVRMSAERTGPFNPLPLDRAEVVMPEWYCGRLDNANPDLVRRVQERLNQVGINVGTPDGSPGGNTRRGVATAQARLLGVSGDDGVITAELVQALGVADGAPAGIGTWTFCDPGYRG